MSKFNKKSTIESKLENHPDRTENYEGGLAFEPDVKLKLLLMSGTALLKNKFYESEISNRLAIKNLVRYLAKAEPVFPYKLAAFLRNQLYLRSISILITAEAMAETPGLQGVSTFVAENIIQRADEITELLSYWLTEYGKPIPIALKKAVALAFNKFDEYQFSKYNRPGLVTLRDALFLAHPRPNSQQNQTTFDAITNKALQPAQTWEHIISTKGPSKENWESIIPNMGYMAIVKNLRNFLVCNVDQSMYLPTLTDYKRVKASRLLPFRFFNAHRMLSKLNTTELHDPFSLGAVLGGLETALEHSIKNIPRFEGRTVIMCDDSGSMTNYHLNNNDRDPLLCADVAALFSVMSKFLSQSAIVIAFSSSAREIHVPAGSMLSAVNALRKQFQGGGTYAYKAMELLCSKDIKTDRIIFFSDNVMYNEMRVFNRMNQDNEIKDSVAYYATTYLRKYLKCHIHFFDMAGYGTVPTPAMKNVHYAGGFSERILDYVKLNETGTSMLSEIESIPF